MFYLALKTMKRINKKGSEKLLSIWWFFVLAVIGVGIVSSVFVFTSGKINVKNVEADILSERLALCVQENPSIASLDNIFDLCGLKKDVFGSGSKFYFRISFYDDNKIIKEIKAGDSSYENDCKALSKTSAKYYPECSEKIIIFNGGKAVILAASNQE